MQIFVKLGSSDELLTLDAVSSDPTIKDIKVSIKDKKHIPLEQQCLFFEGRELKDYKDAEISGNVDAKSSAVRAKDVTLSSRSAVRAEDVERENLTLQHALSDYVVQLSPSSCWLEILKFMWSQAF